MENQTPVPPPAPAPAVTSTEDKTVAVVSYLTIIGFIIALILHGQKKTQLGSFHLRQTLGFVIAGFGMSVIMIIPIIGWLIGLIGFPILFVLWIIGLIAAVQGQMKPVPLVGEYFQKWFAGTFT